MKLIFNTGASKPKGGSWLWDATAKESARHLANSVDELFEYSLHDVDPCDMVGIPIRNEDNQQETPIGIFFRRMDQNSRDVHWTIFDKMTQSNESY